MNNQNEVLNFLINPEFTGWLFVIRIIFIGFSLIFLVLIVLYSVKTTWFQKTFLWDFLAFFSYKPTGARSLAKQWVNVKQRLESGLESEYKLAVIEADSFLDESLKHVGYSGESLGDRLKLLTREVLPNIDQVFESRKIRNNIVHDPDYKLSLDQARKTVEIYEKALKDLHGF